jgi:DNA-binding NarL/FixJ family response regulator
MTMALRPPRRQRDPDPVGDIGTIATFASSGRTCTIIADAQAAFRKGVREHLGYGFVVVGEAASVSELEQVVARTNAALVLVGNTLPGGGVTAAADVIPAAARLVVFADETRNENVLEALELGAAGYLLKSIPAAQLDSALRAVMGGERLLDQSLTGKLAEQIARRGPVPRLRLPTGERVVLTVREHEVATRLGAGHSTKAIADELGISVVTVRRHISLLMRKLGVASRAGVVQLLAG